MPDWEERISHESHPSLRLEHVVRYRAAAPIVHGSDVWCDLGCGTGIASAEGVGPFAGRLVLVDADADAVAEAEANAAAESVVGHVGDLSSLDGLAGVERVLGAAERACLTCFEVLEHLQPFAPLVDWLVGLAGRGHTAVVSVPNDAFWSIENPYHRTRWGESAFAELVALLPAERIVAAQAVLFGSAIAAPGVLLTAEAVLSPQQVPSHFVVAFGPRAGELGQAVGLTPADWDAQRTWERQREADLAYHKSIADRAQA